MHLSSKLLLKIDGLPVSARLSCGGGSRAPVEDGLDGARVYVSRLWPRYLACGPQTPECQRLIFWFLGETSEAVHGSIFLLSAVARCDGSRG